MKKPGRADLAIGHIAAVANALGLEDYRCLARVHDGRCQKPDGLVGVLLVVPAERLATNRSSTPPDDITSLLHRLVRRTTDQLLPTSVRMNDLRASCTAKPFPSFGALGNLTKNPGG